MIEDFGVFLDVLIRLLLVPVLVLAAVLLYRLDRMIASGLHSAELIEDTAENVQRSSNAVYDALGVLERLPGVSRGSKGERNE